jgi:hypothetical protein
MARDLYQSDLFRKSRAYVEARGGRWFILSAAHGLLEPTATIEWYDRQLGDMTTFARQQWGWRVRSALAAAGVTERPITVLAGRLYREAIGLGPSEIVAPLAGLAIGQQLAWLKANAPGGPNQAQASQAGGRR